MGLGIFQADRRYQVAACAVPGQNDLVRVNAQLFCMVKGISGDAVGLFHGCGERFFRSNAVVHIPDQSIQLLHDGAAVAAVPVGAALDEAAAVEVQQQGCFGRQMLRALLEHMDFAAIGHFDPKFCFGAGQCGQLFRTDRAESVTATHLLSRCNFFFQCHFVCFLSGIRMPAALSWCRRYKRRVESA